ncbi:hypothetical protein [Bradyrhizobium commune]|uniref:Uncharacterized protein n=1 Tax=Bradyrhizobium commune TaxID=83627 RepID=A0A7S9GZR9_9BRAD|nr:hypothetical protein [Bradyrhizobium commune]QPF91201.1 hypothetical protein IC761_32905 [Bradyrhizobium commune]
MRILLSVFLSVALLLNNGCAIYEMETTNRGGYIDYVLDKHWLKADSKSMRALRAFAMQVSLARIASVSAKNDSDRQLLAIRIGALTKRFTPIYLCAFENNPLAVEGAERDPCFYYDSAMVDYSTGLFDLAMIALPIDDAKKLLDAATGAAINPISIVDLLGTLLQVGKDAIKYGRVVGALYRDTVELEVQLWLATPAIDTRPPPYRVTEADVAELREIYARRNDDMPSWLAQMGALHARGLEPLPQPKFFFELAGLLNYICDLVTRDPDANNKDTCKANLPKTMPAPAVALGTSSSFRIGDMIKPVRVGGPRTIDVTKPGNNNTGGNNTGGNNAGAATTKTKLNNFELSLTKDRVAEFQTAVCVKPTGEDNVGELGSETRLAIQKALKAPDQLLSDRKGILLRTRLTDGKLKDGVACP